MDNLFADINPAAAEELFTELLRTPGCRLERIVSTGQATPPGQWYDQAQGEWVVLLSGAARLEFTEPEQVCELKPGDYLWIPPHRRHRVAWTDPAQPSVWLALHLTGEAPPHYH